MIIKEKETRVYRTYRGGKLIDRFLGKDKCEDTFQPEDWISSFTAAKNKILIENEGITLVEDINGRAQLITDAVSPADFGEGRTDAGVLIKYLDSAERLGIQVHPTKEFSQEVFHTPYGKTECWHILDTREEGGTVYLGFKPFVTKEYWKSLFEKQDIQGMLNALHCFKVQKGDTILVRGGTPHAIGAGCFLLEIQEPTDYTMRVEKVTVAGEALTPMQIHYGIGEEKMLDCFNYSPMSEEEVRENFFLQPREEDLVRYEDTPCFGLKKVIGGMKTFCFPHFITLVVTETGGTLEYAEKKISLTRGEKYMISAETEFTLKNAETLICLPPQVEK